MNGEKVSVETTNYHTNCGIFLYSHGPDQMSMSVPVDDWLRSQLTRFQNFVIANATIPSDVPQSSDGSYVFKSLLDQNSIMIPLSKWCKIYKYCPDQGTYTRTDNLKQFRKGDFAATIDISHVYIGPHKGGQHFSLSLRVKRVVYQEEQSQVSDTSLLDELLTASSEIDAKKKKKSSKKSSKSEKCSKSQKRVLASQSAQ